jgi:hypothetical protein
MKITVFPGGVGLVTLLLLSYGCIREVSVSAGGSAVIT